jgi:hypothetical protein
MMAATVLAVTGCQVVVDNGTAQTVPEILQSFTLDFVRQALAALML